MIYCLIGISYKGLYIYRPTLAHFLKTLNRIHLISKPNLTYLIPNNPTNFRILTEY
jgi:hypothetical protein